MEVDINKFVEKINKNVKNIKIGKNKIKEIEGQETCPSDEEFAKLASNIGVAEHEKDTFGSVDPLPAAVQLQRCACNRNAVASRQCS